MSLAIAPPAADEYAPFFGRYITALAQAGDIVATLERQQSAIHSLASLGPEQAGYRYAEGKWTVREVVGHVSDTERVMSYRLLRIARGDAATSLPGFDENSFAQHSNADARSIVDLAGELAAVRTSTLALVRSLDAEAIVRRGMVNGNAATVRGLVYITAGHFAHHVAVLRERYHLAI